MSAGEIENGRCDMCGQVTTVRRKYYHYDVECECHSPKHFEIVRHCIKCTPYEPAYTKIHIKTTELKKIAE